MRIRSFLQQLMGWGIVVVLSLGLGCAKPKTIKTMPTPKGPSDEKPKDTTGGRNQGPLESWRFFCVDGQTLSNVVTFQGALSATGQPNYLMVRDNEMLPMTDIHQLRPLEFKKLVGIFSFIGRKLDMDTIRMTPDKQALHFVEMDFYKGETYWLGDFPIYEFPRPMLKDIPWAQVNFKVMGWNPEQRWALVPTEKGTWGAASIKDYSQKAIPQWPLKEYFYPQYWNKMWLLWHWSQETKMGQWQIWQPTENGDFRLQKVLWERGQLYNLSVNDRLASALFVVPGGYQWLVFDRALNIKAQRKLGAGNWLMGFDPDLGRPWVAAANKSDLTVLELEGNDIKTLNFKVPLSENEKGTELGQLAKFQDNLLLQFEKGENRFWKRKNAEVWKTINALDCQGLSYIKYQEAQ